MYECNSNDCFIKLLKTECPFCRQLIDIPIIKIIRDRNRNKRRNRKNRKRELLNNIIQDDMRNLDLNVPSSQTIKSNKKIRISFLENL